MAELRIINMTVSCIDACRGIGTHQLVQDPHVTANICTPEQLHCLGMREGVCVGAQSWADIMC
jgi:hypothetical protein